MFITILRVIIGITVPLILGYLILEAILFKKVLLGFLEKAALSYGMGMGIVSLIMFCLALLKIELTLLNITVSLFIIAIVFLAPSLKAVRILVSQPKNTPKPTPFISKLLIGFIILVCGYVLFRALIIPLAAWDSWAIYGFKAKAFYLEKTVPVVFFKDATKSFSHFDYPLLVPLIEAWIYITVGSWNDQIVKIIFPFYFVGMLIIFYYSLKCYIENKFAILFTALLAAIPQLIYFGSNGYADLPLTFYYFTSVAFLARAFFGPAIDWKLLLISGIFSGLAAWTKNEGLALSLFNVFIISIVMFIQRRLNRQSLLLLVQYALILALIILPWLWFKNSLFLSNDVMNHQNLNLLNILNNLKRLPAILFRIAKEMSLFNSWNGLWVISIVLIIVNFKKIFRFPSYIILISSVLYLATCVLVYIVTPYDFNWHIHTSLSRLLIHIAPLFLFLDALLIFLDKERLQ